MASFWKELRRRNVFRVGIAYLAVIWVLIQVADIVLPVVNARPWILQTLVFSSALGAVKFLGRKIDFAIIGVLVLAVGFLVVENNENAAHTRNCDA
jgi:hypothetical protein